MSWKCVVCDTYNNDSDNECYVCGHNQGGEDAGVAFSVEEKMMDRESSFADDSVDLGERSSLDRSHSEPSGKGGALVSDVSSDEHEKSSKVRIILIASVAIVLLLAALYCYGNLDCYDSYSDDYDLGYTYSDTKVMKYDDVTMNIPEEWECYSFEDDSCKGVKACMLQDDETEMWGQIVSLGDFDSMPEFCYTLKALNVPTDGNPLEINNCQEAVACFEYESVDGYTILSYVVIHNGHGYWIGVGALPDYYDYSYMQDILYNCTFGE